MHLNDQDLHLEQLLWLFRQNDPTAVAKGEGN